MAINTITVGRQVRVKIGASTVCIARFVPKVTREQVKNADGSICGDMWHPINRMRKGRKIIGGSLFFDFTGAVFTHLIQYMGLTSLGSGVYNLAAAGNLTEVAISVDMGATTHTFTNAVIHRWAVRASKGGRPPQLQVDFVGEDETDTGGTPFTDAPLTIQDVFSFTDITTADFDDGAGNTVQLSMDRFLLQVDYGAVVEHNFSVTRTGMAAGAGTAILATSTPYVATRKDIYWDYRDSEGPIDATIEFTNDDTAIEFFAPAGFPITELPPVLGKSDQIRTPVTLDLCRTDNTGTRVSPLTITIAAAP